jgi:hypothetical protein
MIHRDDLPLQRCSVAWSDLRPAGRDRACDTCARTVIDLSTRTEREARRLLATTPRPCLAYRSDDSGRIAFQPGPVRRLALALVALSAVVSPAFAADVLVTTGIAPPVERTCRLDFGGGGEVTWLLGSRRFPSGGSGRAWISVTARTTGKVWRKVVLRCRTLREAQPFPRDGWYRFGGLPEGEDCEVRARGGGLRPVNVPVVTPQAEDPSKR